VDESIEDRSSSHSRPGRIGERRWGFVGVGWELLSCLVRPVPVVMGDVVAQCGEQVLLAVDEDVVQALAAGGADPAFRVRVGPRSQLHRMRTIGTNVCG